MNMMTALALVTNDPNIDIDHRFSFFAESPASGNSALR